MWPSVQSTPDDYDAVADFSAMLDEWEPVVEMKCRIPWMLQSSFRCWVGLHEEVAEMDASGAQAELEARRVAGSISNDDQLKLKLLGLYTMMTINNRLSGDHSLLDGVWVTAPSTLYLRHLKPGDDPESLEWAAEYLSANIALFIAESEKEPRTLAIYPARWVEADGGVNTLEHKIKQQRLALSGIANHDYIPDPIRSHRLEPFSSARALVEGRWMESLMNPKPIAELTPRELMQLTYISIAMKPPRNLQPDEDEGEDEYYERDIDDWSLALLKRYLRASGHTDPRKLRDTTVIAVRNALAELLRISITSAKPDPSLLEVTKDPPGHIEPELFIRLVWRWGYAFAKIWARQSRV